MKLHMTTGEGTSVELHIKQKKTKITIMTDIIYDDNGGIREYHETSVDCPPDMQFIRIEVD